MADQIDVVRELLNTVGTDLAFVVNHSGGAGCNGMLPLNATLCCHWRGGIPDALLSCHR
jgi:hypothetical protein